MKKVIAFLMIVALVMSFAACNKSNSNGIVDKNAEAPSKAGDTSKEEVESIQGNATATEVSDKNDTAKENEKGSSNEEDVTKPPHVHEYTDEVVVQTCTKDGYTKHTCNCGNSYVDTKVSAVGHKYGEWKVTKEPTTKETGAKERKCSACDVKETQTIGKLIENHTHTFTESLTKAATCSAEGVKTFTCSCGEKYTENIEKTAHKYVETVVTPV